MQFHKRENQDVSNYLKIKDGESVTGSFQGQIFSFRAKWENGRSITIPEPEKVRHNRYKVNFITKENNKFVAKTWEFGNTVYDQLSDINADLPITKQKIKITRRGSMMETTYTIVALGALDAKTLAEIQAVPLLALNGEPIRKETPPNEDSWPESVSDDAAF